MLLEERDVTVCKAARAEEIQRDIKAEELSYMTIYLIYEWP